MTRSAKASVFVLAGITVFWVWYGFAANYDYDALAGSYVLHADGETYTLRLRPDQTFSEELSRSGKLQDAEGTWHRYGESHVSFSEQFLVVGGKKEMGSEKLTDNLRKR